MADLVAAMLPLDPSAALLAWIGVTVVAVLVALVRRRFRRRGEADRTVDWLEREIYRSADLQRRLSLRVIGVGMATVVLGTAALAMLTRKPAFVSNDVAAYSAAFEERHPIAGDAAPRTRDAKLQRAIDHTCTAELASELDRMFPAKTIHRFEDGQPSGGHVVAASARWDRTPRADRETAAQAASLCIFAGKGFEVRDARTGRTVAVWNQGTGYLEALPDAALAARPAALAPARAESPVAAQPAPGPPRARLISIAPIDGLPCYEYPAPGADARSTVPELSIRLAPNASARVVDVVSEHWSVAALTKCGDWVYVSAWSGAARAARGWVLASLLTRGWSADGRGVLGIDDFGPPEAAELDSAATAPTR